VPFTLAHPAAVLPLRGVRHLRMAPLVVGAMVPDLPYYLPSRVARLVPATHGLGHSLTVDLALGLALLAGLVLLRRPLTALLSRRARTLCLRALTGFDRVSEWALAAPAIVLGVWTHLLWDSFTHRDGWMVHRVSALSAPLTVGPYSGTVCHALQYLTSVLGLCVLALWYARLPPPAVDAGRDAPRSAAGPVLLLVAAAALLIGGVEGVKEFRLTHSVYSTLYFLLTDGLTWFAALYLTAGIVLTLEHGAQQLPVPATDRQRGVPNSNAQ
jgi:Domain of unknown function (DUF4184)